MRRTLPGVTRDFYAKRAVQYGFVLLGGCALCIPFGWWASHLATSLGGRGGVVTVMSGDLSNAGSLGAQVLSEAERSRIQEALSKSDRFGGLRDSDGVLEANFSRLDEGAELAILAARSLMPHIPIQVTVRSYSEGELQEEIRRLGAVRRVAWNVVSPRSDGSGLRVTVKRGSSEAASREAENLLVEFSSRLPVTFEDGPAAIPFS